MTKISNQYSLTNVLFADTTNGRVGIGTASPTDKLEIQDGNLSTYHSVNLATAGYGINFYTNGGGSKNTIASISPSQVGTARSGALIFLTSNSGAPTERMRLTSGGSVGINNSNPVNAAWGNETNTKQLSIDATDYSVINLQGGSRKYSMGVGNDIFYMCYDNTAARHNIVVTSAGNIGMGTNAPARKLHVNGDMAIGFGLSERIYSDASYIELYNASTGDMTFFNGYFAGAIKFITNSSLRMTIAANGSIGAPSGTNIYNASDARLKRNIETIDSGLNKVMALNPVKFNWIENYEPSEEGKDMLGFIAQEVLLAVPEAVENFASNKVIVDGQEIDDVLRVNEKFIIPVLVKAIQELSAQASEQQTQINELKALINV
jgi:hypothetical protein